MEPCDKNQGGSWGMFQEPSVIPLASGRLFAGCLICKTSQRAHRDSTDHFLLNKGSKLKPGVCQRSLHG